MPRFDGTGPRGQGPRTGGGVGYCPPVARSQVYGAPIVYGVGRGGIPRGGGRGWAFGGGRGRGRRFWGVAPGTPAYVVPGQMTVEDEIALLQEQSHAMQDQLHQITARIADLTSEQGEE